MTSMPSTDAKPRAIELLSPARNLACGIEAIRHGADAVYIGAERFGARAAAGNSVEDIARLCDFAHQFGVRIYVTLNTLLFDDELEQARQLAWNLYAVGVDALIVQDMALLKLDLPPIALHASTQTDIRTSQKVAWLNSLGFRQVVLARELSLDEIRAVHEAVPEVALEAFVHGALCVSYSGRCNASQACFGRSANRGECAQFCRLPFTLTDRDGHVLVRNRHILSLRDMNRSSFLEQMMDAGISSFKIEGRLKDASYVKNVTAYYRLRIDEILARRPEYCRASLGREEFTFEPDPRRSFSRGETDYFLHGRSRPMTSPATPKSRGLEVGRVKAVCHDHIVVSSTASFSNGDGLCFFNSSGELQGFRVNRAQDNRLYPAVMPVIEPQTELYRNYDQKWERLMAQQTAVRRIPIEWVLGEISDGFNLSVQRQDGMTVSKEFVYEHQLANAPQQQVVSEVLSKTGGTVWQTEKVTVNTSADWFIPRSLLAQWRREVLEALLPSQSLSNSPEGKRMKIGSTNRQEAIGGAIFSNHLSRQFYEEQGITSIEPAMELTSPSQIKVPLSPWRGDRNEAEGTIVMTCRFCIRYEMGWCPRHQTPSHVPAEPLYLLAPNGRRFRFHFDCTKCQSVLFVAPS